MNQTSHVNDDAARWDLLGDELVRASARENSRHGRRRRLLLAVPAVGLAAATVAALSIALPAGPQAGSDEPPLITARASAEPSHGGPAKASMSVFSRTAAPPPPKAMISKLVASLAHTDRVPDGMQPGSFASLASARTLLDDPTSGVQIYAIPTQTGGVCTISDQTGGGCISTIPPSGITHTDGSGQKGLAVGAMTELPSSVPLTVAGMASDDVKSIEIEVGSVPKSTAPQHGSMQAAPPAAAPHWTGHTTPATLGNNGWAWTGAQHDGEVLRIVVHMRDGSTAYDPVSDMFRFLQFEIKRNQSSLIGDRAVRGTAGDDRMRRPDVKGQVVMYGRAGDDHMSTDVDADGTDMYGGIGNDLIEGGPRNDGLHGGAGNDRLLDLQGGADGFTGGDGDDLIVAGPGDDYIDGGAGNDTIRGGSDNDYIFGGMGLDHIDAGAGNDLVRSQEDDGVADVIDCGPGLDVAYIRAGDVTSNCEHVHIVTRDFSNAPGIRESYEGQADPDA